MKVWASDGVTVVEVEGPLVPQQLEGFHDNPECPPCEEAKED